MSNDNKNVLFHVSEILAEAKSEIAQIFLVNPVGGTIEIMVDSKLNQLINSLGHMGAGVFAKTTSVQNEFPPITNFMGEKIELRKDLKEEDLNPTISEEDAFIAKVDYLEKNLTSLTNADILRSYVGPDDTDAIRGVALRADMLDYETRPIDGAFLDELRAALATKAQRTEAKIKAEQAVAASQQQPVKPVELSEAEKTALLADITGKPSEGTHQVQLGENGKIITSEDQANQAPANAVSLADLGIADPAKPSTDKPAVTPNKQKQA